MELKKILSSMFVCAIIGTCIGVTAIAEAEPFQVLVVMSYEEDYPWCQEIKEGIDMALGKESELTYFYMNTKRDFEGGPQRAEEAYALFQELQPDGVITADDNAQSMFVVPYLKDKVETPVMFCAVNADPEKYGYPASNVSGILERYHIKPSIAFVQQLDPTIETIGFITRDSTTGAAISKQVEHETDQYPAQPVGFKLVKTLKEAIAETEAFREESDVLLMTSLEGILDEEGNPLEQKDIIPALVKAYGKPTISTSPHLIEYGVLCAVVQSGQEHGATAGEMLLQAMQGTPVAEIPLTQNRQGARIINATMLKELGITPRPEILRGAKIVKMAE